MVRVNMVAPQKRSNLIRWCGSMAEQLIRNEQVVGSIPTTSSKIIRLKKMQFMSF